MSNMSSKNGPNVNFRPELDGLKGSCIKMPRD